MRLSNYLLPVLKETPSEASIISHQLMLRAGMIRQLSSGIYSWLPLGLKVLRNVEKVVREEMNKAGGVELLMPTMQPASLWKESGRGDYGKETLRVTDRHDNDLIYGPTNEEVITDIFRGTVKSYKELPLNLYHVQWKFRDEIRPRFGVMRGREFLMKDAYSFDIDEESAKKSYDIMYRAYFKIFKRLGLKAIPVKADTGAIGGDMSHEFQVIAGTGESEIFYDPKFEDLVGEDELDIDKLRSLYAAADEMHDVSKAPADVKTARGIEVGHIFYLGTKYSAAMGADIQTPDGKKSPVHMGCYGIGVSRLIGAIIEASHDDNGIIWPESIAPFDVAIINVKPGHEGCDTACDTLYHNFSEAGIDALLDDRKESAGSKFATQELIGTPWSIAVGPRSIENGMVELKNRAAGTKEEVTVEQAIAKFTA
jgi:prolyl-tRNA synthetase